MARRPTQSPTKAGASGNTPAFAVSCSTCRTNQKRTWLRFGLRVPPGCRNEGFRTAAGCPSWAAAPAARRLSSKQAIRPTSCPWPECWISASSNLTAPCVRRPSPMWLSVCLSVCLCLSLSLSLFSRNVQAVVHSDPNFGPCSSPWSGNL